MKSSAYLKFLLAYACFHITWSFQNKCRREPESTEFPKSPGDGGFKIEIGGNPDRYISGEVYTISIKGKRSYYQQTKFSGFLLIVESARVSQLYRPHSVGTFELYGATESLHSELCPNAITTASKLQKPEIQVRWTAPPAGSGCLVFKATVETPQGKWYMDDGDLTKELCEENQPKSKQQLQLVDVSDCCACDEAKYEVTFEGLWSRQTHPKDYPKNEWLTHFSDIIGASHSNKYRIWEEDELASPGLKQVAEWGSTRALESELKRQSDHIRTIIKARGLWYPKVNGKTFAVLRVDNRHHLMSLVSMLGPSPDWIVGVSAMDLCMKNCSWLQNQTINLYPWDAGSDSGVTYMSANAPTIPRERIRRITNNSPNNPRSPFYDSKGIPMKPLATLTITRQRIYEKSCSDLDFQSYDENEDYGVETGDENEIPECATTEWSQFSPCSMTCGKGLKQRTREYMNPHKVDMFQCNRQLVETEMCAGLVPYCEGGDENNMHGSLLAPNFDPQCATTPWSKWIPCSVTCGKGFKTRTRRYLRRMGRKKCNEILVERQPCVGDVPDCRYDNDNVDPACVATQWSNWSPCSVTCGKGFRARTRHFLLNSANEEKCNMKTVERIPCEGERPDCTLTAGEAKEICNEPNDSGPCRGYYTRYYYDVIKRMCVQFVYGGCKGNKNNFGTLEECTSACENNRDLLNMNESTNNHYLTSPLDPQNYNTDSLNRQNSDNVHETHQHYGENVPEIHEHYGKRKNMIPDINYKTYFERQNVKTSNSRTASNKFDSNHINGLTPASQVGSKVNCEVSEWSKWSICSVTCGNGWIEKTRYVKVNPDLGGKKCPKKLKRRKKCRRPKCNKPHHNLESMSFVFDPEYYSPIAPSSDRFHSLLHQKNENEVDDLTENKPNINCLMGPWSEWSACTQSCGSEALQQRSRNVIGTQENGKKCPARLQRRYCSLPPCPPITWRP